MIKVATAQVPYSEFRFQRGIFTAAPSPDVWTVNLDPWKYRRKLWIAVGVVNTPASLVLDGFVAYYYKGEQMLQLPYIVNARTGQNVWYGPNASFGTATDFTLFDEPLYADYGGKYIACTPFRSTTTADKAVFHLDRFAMAGGDTFFGYLAVLSEYPY